MPYADATEMSGINDVILGDIDYDDGRIGNRYSERPGRIG